MTGPQHYSAAEQLLSAANRRLAGNDAEWLNTPLRRAELRADAQVHATLASTAFAATAELVKLGVLPPVVLSAWTGIAEGHDREPAPRAAGQQEDW